MNQSFERERKSFIARLRAQSMKMDDRSLRKYKRVLFLRVAGSFLLVFVIILERIFSEYTKSYEDRLITSLQSFFNISQTSEGRDALSWLRFFHTFKYSNLVFLHCYLFLYYWKNPVIALKVMLVHYNFLALIANLEILFAEPRPYWMKNDIVGVCCEDSYAFPSYSMFSFVFLIIYSESCLNRDDDDDEDDEEEEKENPIWKKIKWSIFGVFILAFGFFAMVMGLSYMTQILLAVLYSLLIYFIVKFFERSFNNLTMNSSFIIPKAKRYSISWFIYVVIIAALSTVVYLSADTFLDIDWVTSFSQCLKATNDDSYKTRAYYHIIGPWASFLKTSVIFGLLGMIFGIAKVFRQLRGIAWFITSRKNRAIMTILSNLCAIPLWILTAYEESITGYLGRSGINKYIYYAITFWASYYFLFGILPTPIFRYFGFINLNADYVSLDLQDYAAASNRVEEPISSQKQKNNFDIN